MHRAERGPPLGNRMHLGSHVPFPQELITDLEDDIPTQPCEGRLPCRVLVVDDDYLVRARLSALLRAAHYDVEVAAAGEEALRILSVSHCHIVLTDWLMPEMDGLALCRHVRINEDDAYVYVLMLTVRESKEDMLMGLAAGADDYVAKSASIDEILARLEIGRRITYVREPLPSGLWENRHAALTDARTGAHNLLYFLKRLPHELSRSPRYEYTARANGRQRPRPPDDSPAALLGDFPRAFQTLLQYERVHLVTLSAALARAEENPSRIFAHLVFRARKLHGGAISFEITEIAAAARSLEQAANRALISGADNADTSVWATLIALVNLMGTVDARGI